MALPLSYTFVRADVDADTELVTGPSVTFEFTTSTGFVHTLTIPYSEWTATKPLTMIVDD